MSTQSLHSSAPLHPGAKIAPGVWPVMFTPYQVDGSIDFDAIPALVDFYLDAGCAGIFPVAGSGEMFFLSQDERDAVARATVEAVGGRAQVLGGGGFGDDWETWIESARRMSQTGVDCVVLISSTVPVSRRPWEHEEVVDQLIRASEEIDFPLGLYECPSPEHRLLNPEGVRRLAETGRFLYFKETGSDVEAIAAKVAASLGTPMRVYPANLNAFLLPRMEGVGGFGGIQSNVLPDVMVAVDRMGENNRALCEAIHSKMLELEAGYLNEMYPASGKYLLQLRGLPIRTLSRMGKNPTLNPEQEARVEALIESMNDIQSVARGAATTA